MRSVSFIAAALGLAILAITSRAADKAIPIEVPPRTATVDFETEIVPILRANCSACHTEKKTEGGLILDSLSTLLKGGDSGPAVVAGKSAESLLLKVAAHQQQKFMPPANNTLGAKALTPGQLGLMKLWIDQGATGSAPAARVVQFQPLPKGFQPIFATAVTPDGQFALCSRGNRIDVYHLPTATHVTSLIDPELNRLAVAHQDVIRSLAVDPTGSFVASGSFREVKLWRRPGVNRVAEWAHDEPVRCVTLSTDGKWAATGDEKGQLRIWELGSGKTLASFAGHKEAVTGVAFAPDGSTLYSTSLDKTLRAWKRSDGSALGQVDASSPIQALALVGRGEWLAIGSDDGSIRVWDAKKIGDGSSQEPLRIIKAHEQAIAALAVDPASDRNILSGADRFVRVWNSQTGKQIREIKANEPVLALAVRPDGRRIATSGKDGVTIWDADNGKSVARIQGDPLLAHNVAKLDTEIATAKSAVGFAKQDLNSYEGLVEVTKRLTVELKKLEDELAKAMKTRDEKKAAFEKAKTDAKSDPEPVKAKEDAKKKDLVGKKAKVDGKGAIAAEKAAKEAEEAVALSETVVTLSKAIVDRSNEKLAATRKALADQEATVKRLEQAKSAAVATVAAARPTITSLAFSVDCSRLAIGFESGALHVYSAESGTLLESREEHKGALRGMAFGPNGTFLTVSADRRAIVWNAPDGWSLERTIGGPKQSPALLADRVLTLDFSPDGKWLATGGGVPARSGELKIWNVADGRLFREIKDAHADTVFSVRFSPDGRRLASASADRFVKVFDLPSGDCLRTLSGQSNHVLGVSWKSDGTLLASCGADNVLKVWEAETGGLVRTLKGGIYDNGTYKREVTAAAFVGDTEAILAVSGDGTVRLHRAGHSNDVMKFAGSEGYQYSAAVTPDGKSIIAGGSDGVLRAWMDRDQKLKHSFRP